MNNNQNTNSANAIDQTRSNYTNPKPHYRTWPRQVINLLALLALILCQGCSAPTQTSTPSPGKPAAGGASRPTNTLHHAPTKIPTSQPTKTSAPTQTLSPAPAPLVHQVEILVDDFAPQPLQGDEVYFYNRLEGDRGALNNSAVVWENGLVKATIAQGTIWGGLWMSLNHPIREAQSINFSAVLPPQILPRYQSKISGIKISVSGGTASRIFRAELKDSANNLQWTQEMVVNGEPQILQADLPELGEINQLVLVLDHADGGDSVTLDTLTFTATTSITDTATAAFVWSYAMLLNNWNPDTGLVRDRATDPSGVFDAIQATGSLAAATALAEQVGVVNHEDAIAIVNKIGDALLNKLPRNHGLWPHWVNATEAGVLEIKWGTEWSSIDTVIAAVGLLDAQQALGLETSAAEKFLREIEWNNLITKNGVSMGYTYDNMPIPYAWDVFGGESWLVDLAYASATGKIPPLAHPPPPTANGSGFIDELAWLYLKPPTKPDYWGTDWTAYRSAAANAQISYYAAGKNPTCFGKLGLFGLSAGEAPVPAFVEKAAIYQAYGIGGQFSPANDGVAVFGAPVVVPHYSAIIASLNPPAALKMWGWLIDNGYFSPLNNVESLVFSSNSSCDPGRAEWNQLKGSWNLALQTLGWGRYLAERAGMVPAVWQTTLENQFLKQGYALLAPNE